MSLAPLQLDDRKFQDLVDEAKKRIDYYCEEWTDHNVSDPGVTLIELFAWMTELLIYRLNQVPTAHYIQFLRMFGITLADPIPATTEVTFRLSKPLPAVRLASETPASIKLPGGTEVASTQTEKEPSIIFSTDKEIEIYPPHLSTLAARITRTDGQNQRETTFNLATLVASKEGELIFASAPGVAPLVGSALYFGFETDLSHHILRLELNMRLAGGAGVVPEKPPYVWEVATGLPAPNHWKACVVEADTTGALCKDGQVILHLPAMGKYAVDNKTLFWVRVRVREITEEEKAAGMQPYRESPRLRAVLNEQTLGVTVVATQARLVVDEYLGRSDGTHGQRFALQSTPILARREGETLVVMQPGQPDMLWQEVRDFASSGMDDKHFVLDSASGELRLGPAIRQRDGTIKLYGAAPPRGALLMFRRYRCGGGQKGNIKAGEINTLKSSLPFVDKVENRIPASGGLDEESLDEALIKASALIRTRERAITAEDFEQIAFMVLREKISRTKCIQVLPENARKEDLQNLVYLLVIARVDFPEGRLRERDLLVSSADLEALSRKLEERRPLTMRIRVQAPSYTWINVKVYVTIKRHAQRKDVENELLSRLYRFINPITGGADQKGWPFGRAIYLSDITPCLHNVPGVEFIRNIEMFEADREGNPLTAKAEPFFKLVAHGVIASGRHSIEISDLES